MKISVLLTADEIWSWISICEFAAAYCAIRKLESMTDSERAAQWTQNIAVIESLEKQLKGIVGK